MIVRPDLVAELDKLAEATGHSRSELAEQALAEYLDVQRAQIEGVRTALRDLEAGRPDLSHERSARVSWSATAGRASRSA